MGFFDPFCEAADVGELKSDLSSVKSDVETHTNNNDIHVTASDKSNWDSKLDKNQGSENSGKVLGTNANGEVVPLNGYGFEYDEETKMLKYGTDPTLNLNQGIGLDDTLSKRGYAADAGAVGELKEDLDYRFISVKSAQLLDKSQCIVGKSLESVVSVSTPYDLIDASTNVVSNIICKEKGKRITYATNLASTRSCKLLGYVKNDNGNYVRADYYSGITKGESYNTVTFTENTELIRMSIPIGEWNRLNITENGWYFCKEEDWTADISKEYGNYSYLANTKVKEESILLENPINYKGNEVGVFFYGIACGDSLTEGTFNTEIGFENHKQYAYPVFFNKKTGVKLRNFGVGGSTAKSWYERYQNVEFPIYDFAVIAFGVNDLLQGVEDTTINYLTNIVNKLKSKNPKVKCFIATVNKAYKSASANYDILNENIRDFAKTTDGCYLLDIAKYGLTEEGTDFVNGHLTAIGYNELAREYANLISWNIHNNTSDFADIQFSGTTYTSLPTD